MNHHSHYRGYAVHADATPLHNGLYAANLQIEQLAECRREAARFAELDYFFEASQAVAYATRWARMWIDGVQSQAENLTVGTDQDPGRGPGSAPQAE